MRRTSNMLYFIFWINQIVKIHMTPILGGQIVTSIGDVSKYPYMVSLQERIEESRNYTKYQHFCGGSLINIRWILTAAHCVWRKQIDSIIAVIGHENISYIPENEHYSLDRMELKSFQSINLQNDIALLHLTKNYLQPFNTFTTINAFAQLPVFGMKANRKSIDISDPCKVIGYGATRQAADVQKYLMEAMVKVISKKKCRKALGYVWAPHNGENTICASGYNQNTCQGDSGGPLICMYNNRNYIYGIISHGISCELTNIPGIYTVTVPYVDWINFIINS